jgi:hypothetical protein
VQLDLRFRTKGQLGADVLHDAYADGLSCDFVCGDETSDAVKLSSGWQSFLRQAAVLPAAWFGNAVVSS